MSLIDTVPVTDVTVPTFLRGMLNGRLDPAILRAPDGSTLTSHKMFLPVSYAMQALHAASKGITDRTTGRYRTYEQQVNLFLSRYRTYDTGSGSTKWWQGTKYWKLPGVAMAATPGTSNHGLGLADDMAEELDADAYPESMSDAQLTWLRDNALRFGFGLDTRSERWHWHWIGRDALSQDTVDTLATVGVTVPNLAIYGFVVPEITVPYRAPDASAIPTPPGYPAMRYGATDASTVIELTAPDGRVTWLQAVIGVPMTGTYDTATVNKIIELQRIGGITVDGIYGRQTEAKFIEWRGH